MTEIKLAVASDIHAEDADGKWTHVLSEPPEPRRKRHPLRDLTDLIHEHALVADYLIVPGDVANRADAGGLAYAWRRLQSIAQQLDARLIAIPGNHDVVTRELIDDPRTFLKSLLPTFPTGCPAADDIFWRNGWCVIERESHRLLLLDSTIGFPQFPEGVDKDSAEWATYLTALDRGSITTAIEQAIDDYLSNNLTRKVNIAVIHHHPREHQDREYLKDEYGPMQRGGELIDILSRHPRAGRWILVHGHKHIPQLVNSVGNTSNGPLILCAGSTGAKLWPPINSVTRNQFHLVNVSDELTESVGSLCGRVDTYTWGYGEGWNHSERRGSGLPARSGFGCAEDFRSIAAKIIQLMNSASLQFLDYSEVERSVPQLSYLLPLDFEYLEDELESNGFRFERDRYDFLVQLSRMARA
ncbi:metallophosphoesterase family protein [Mycolicibacter minnesotensis]